MRLQERQNAFSREIDGARTEVDVLRVLARVAEEFGFDYLTLMTMPKDTEGLMASEMVQTTLPAAFLEEFDRKQLIRECPVLPGLFTSIMPRTWSLDDLHDTALRFPPAMEDLMRRFRLITTAVLPLQSIDGQRFLLRFDGDRPGLDQGELNELGMIALHAFDVFGRIRRDNREDVRGPLSTRELEVLRWTAQGKTSAEIGRILSLSDHTINAHMNNAIRKMDCTNRTHLVAKAMRLGLIA